MKSQNKKIKEIKNNIDVDLDINVDMDDNIKKESEKKCQ